MAKVHSIRRKAAKRIALPTLVHQFLIVLSGTDPLVWRRMQVPEKCSFWDLHVAIQVGDDWEHAVVHEGMEPAEDGLLYPRCVSGARRCPPEDGGGVHGFAEFLKTIADPRHPQHKSMLQWSGGDYDPEGFNPEAVKFDDPTKRWKKAFKG
jgi:hypothetical protein